MYVYIYRSDLSTRTKSRKEMPLNTNAFNPGGGVGLYVRDNLRLSLTALYAHMCMWVHRHT